jgi:hypothetical protein
MELKRPTQELFPTRFLRLRQYAHDSRGELLLSRERGAGSLLDRPRDGVSLRLGQLQLGRDMRTRDDRRGTFPLKLDLAESSPLLG